MRKIEMGEKGRYDEIAIAVHITRGMLRVFRAREMTERLHIHFDKITSRSDGALVGETEIRARDCEREVGCCEIRAHVDLFMRTCSRPPGGPIVLVVRNQSHYTSCMCPCMYVYMYAYTHTYTYMIASNYRLIYRLMRTNYWSTGS